MSLDKAFCLVHLLKTEKSNERMQAWLFSDDGVLKEHLANVTLEELNRSLERVYQLNRAQIVILTPNGKCSIRVVSINKGQMKFARQVIESSLEPLLASDIEETHFEFTVRETVAHVCVVDKTELATWRDLTSQIQGTVIGLYALESILSDFAQMEGNKVVMFSEMAFVRSEDHIVAVPPSVFALRDEVLETQVIDGPDIARMLRSDTPLLNLQNNKSQNEITSVWSVLSSWYVLPSVILFVLFIILEFGSSVLSQKTKAIDNELLRSYKILYPDERVVSLHRQFQYKFNALRAPQQSQTPDTVYGVFLALEKTAQSLVGKHSIESLDYAGDQYTLKWKTNSRAQLDQIRKSLIRQGVSITLVSWQRSDNGFVGNYIIQEEGES